MKSSLKKLAVFVIITVISTFILAATVTADPRGHRAIRGQYASTGSGTCYIAMCGFASNLIANGAKYGLWVIQNNSTEAVWTFGPNRTGTAEGTTRAVIHPMFAIDSVSPYYLKEPGSYPASPQTDTYAAEQNFIWNFTYDIGPGGSIAVNDTVPPSYNITYVSGPQGTKSFTLSGSKRHGTMSPDGKIITLNGGLPDPPMALSPPLVDPSLCLTLGYSDTTHMICNSTTVLIMLGDDDD